MQKNKRLIIFTYDYPYGKSEKTFIEYELKRLSEEYQKIEIINQKNVSSQNVSTLKKKDFKFENSFANIIKTKNIIKVFTKEVIFDKKFWCEIIINLFKKNFFKKIKMIINEMCLSYLLAEFIKKRYNKNDSIIFYSFWSNYNLIAFENLKKTFTNSKFISRALGSDLNGFIKNDDYVAYKRLKFSSLDKLILLGDYQKKKLIELDLGNKIAIAPLGIYPQKIQNFLDKSLNSKDMITFTSCGNLIDIKNIFLMIKFLIKFSEITKKQIKFILIGNGILKKKILNQLNSQKLFDFEYHEYIESFTNFLNINKTHFFLNFSSQEGMPFTIMESMSLGIPSITSNIEPNKFLVENNGYYFDLKNFDGTIVKLIHEIDNDINEKKPYLSKSLKSYEFIHNNLINENCHKKFDEILKNL